MNGLLYWILAVLMFGFIVVIHELGHFWAARLTGVGVLEFAVGFGPKIFARKAKSGVLYTIRALPFGGFCRFVDEEGEGEGRGDGYYQQAIWKRALVSAAGPLMNILTALLLVFLVCFLIGLPVGREPVVEKLMPGLPAAEVGFQVNDRIIAINGEPVTTTLEVSEKITAAGEGDIAFTLLRGEDSLTLHAAPRYVPEEGRAMIGIEYRAVMYRFGFFEAIKASGQLTANMATEIIRVLRNLIFRGEGVGELSGFVGTVVVIKEETQQGGLSSYLQLAAIISVNLGLFNLLPVPGLDGSRLIFLALEKIRGKRMDPNKEGAVMLIGFAFMVVIMVLAMYQDIARLIK